MLIEIIQLDADLGQEIPCDILRYPVGILTEPGSCYPCPEPARYRVFVYCCENRATFLCETDYRKMRGRGIDCARCGGRITQWSNL